MNTPAALAVVDGIAGDNSASAKKPGFFQTRLSACETNNNAKRSPKPVLTNVGQKAVTKIDTTWFDTDDDACSNVNVFVNKLTVIASLTPTATASKLTQIVAAKIANSCHASDVNVWFLTHKHGKSNRDGKQSRLSVKRGQFGGFTKVRSSPRSRRTCYYCSHLLTTTCCPSTPLFDRRFRLSFVVL